MERLYYYNNLIIFINLKLKKPIYSLDVVDFELVIFINFQLFDALVQVLL